MGNKRQAVLGPAIIFSLSMPTPSYAMLLLYSEWALELASQAFSGITNQRYHRPISPSASTQFKGNVSC